MKVYYTILNSNPNIFVSQLYYQAIMGTSRVEIAHQATGNFSVWHGQNKLKNKWPLLVASPALDTAIAGQFKIKEFRCWKLVVCVGSTRTYILFWIQIIHALLIWGEGSRHDGVAHFLMSPNMLKSLIHSLIRRSFVFLFFIIIIFAN